ncbi:hypothetical protein BC830DRAFT_1176074 [Chytriomyces sp. MP71]|nr:hypothetical protein BC830DRAFT_1176074 [Chytriomyces sp. MP71]
MRSVSWRHSRAAITAAVLTTLPLLASGYSVALSAYDPSTCTGVLGGSSLKLLFDQSASISAPALLSVLVYNIADEERFVDPVSGRATLCPPGKYCAGQFIVQDSQPFKHPYLNLAVTFNDSHQASIWRNTFDFADTGLYCVATELNTPDEGHSLDFRINALFEAPYGKLPGADFPKLGVCSWIFVYAHFKQASAGCANGSSFE